MDEPWRPRRKHRKMPYYKVQVFDDKLKIWRDERGAFDSESEARRYISSKLPEATARLMLVEQQGRRPL
jgi:hypothetical protein